jgi:phosphatidate cytidylyltransferase
MPLFRTLQWAYFMLGMFGTYGDNLHTFFLDKQQFHYLTHITELVDTTVFALYCVLFIATVLTFKKGLIRFQLGQLMWTFVTVFFVVYQVKYIAATALAGLFWFFFPMATVVMNDVSAYFCGITMGRKFIDAPFISLSPNKTWEGFIGAAVLTVIFSFFFPLLLARFQWFICPADDIYITPWVHQLSCTPHAVFLPALYLVPAWVPLLGGSTLSLLPIQLHGIAYGLFASLVAPFGGFMASAIKRAYNIKDFEALIPGHGGVFDRMDCQLLMISFTWVHYTTFIAPKTLSVSRILAAIALLSIEDKQAVFAELKNAIGA